MFDDDDGEGSYDEEMDDGDMELQAMTVHDLHVEEAAGAAVEAGGSKPGAPATAGKVPAAATGRIASSAGAAKALAALGAVAAAAKAGGSSSASPAPDAAPAGPAAKASPPATAAAAVGREVPKLIFYIGERRLPSTATVFQAVQQLQQAAAAAAAAEEEQPGAEGAAGQPRGRRLWDDVHTLHYRKASDVLAEEQEAAAAAAAVIASGGSAAAAGGDSTLLLSSGWSALPLGELLGAAGIFRASDAAEPCKEVMQLLLVRMRREV